MAGSVEEAKDFWLVALWRLAWETLEQHHQPHYRSQPTEAMELKKEAAL
jgi:hypothetical protein